ncbi:MAG: hypothetical protein KA886_06995 [Candidatus Cloacimonetes bacterium]|nr:hypothetical protein [Candidatus Cloacimonadota bacterium]
MKKIHFFITYFLVFFSPILLIMLSLELALRHIPNDYKHKMAILEQKSSQIDMLILGNSHTLHDINPEYLSDNTYNLAYSSQTLDLDYLILEKYIKRMTSLKSIILPVSYFSLHKNLEDSEEKWRYKNYVLYLKVLRTFDLVKHSEVLSNSLRINIKRLLTYYIKKENPLICNDKGFADNYEGQDKADFDVMAIQTAQSHELGSVKTYRKNTRLMEKICQMTAEKGIRLILIYPPADHRYFKALNADKALNNEKFINNLCEKYQHISYLDFSKDSRFTLEDFYDVDHLNLQGSEKLSRKIAEFTIKSTRTTKNTKNTKTKA